MSALTINGDPVGVAVGGWVEDDSYPAEPTVAVDSDIRSPVTSARPHVRAVQFRSVDMDRTDAETLEATLTGGVVTLAGDLPGASLSAIAREVTLEPWDEDPTRVAGVSAVLEIDQP